MRLSFQRGAIIASAFALASLTAPAVAQAQSAPKIKISQGKTQAAFSYKDAIREYVMVESTTDSDSDGKKDRIRVDIIRPKESNGGLKVPAVIDESPYYDTSGRGNEAEKKTYDASGNPQKFPLFYDNYFVPRGYAVLNVDMVGTNKSDGCPDTGGAADVLGGKAVIDWLNGRAKGYKGDGTEAKATWSTGKAGMIGKSYDGTLANAVAATGVKGLETIVPISAISTWYRYNRMNGYIYWKNYPGYLAGAVDSDPDAKCAAVRDKMNADSDDATGNYNAFFKERDYIKGTVGTASKIRASVFAVHTVGDLNVKPDHFSKWWEALAARGVPRKVWLAQYGHVDPFDFPGRRDLWADTLNRWFAHFLHGVNNGVTKEPRADVQLSGNKWITQADWPARTSKLSLRPQKDGSLGTKRAPAGTTGTFKDDTKLPETDLAADPTTGKPYRLAYTSGALDRSFRLSGTPKMSLKLKLDKPTSNLTALLVDYGEDDRINYYYGAKSGIKNLAEESCHGEGTETDDPCYKKVADDTVKAPFNVVGRGWVDAQNRHSLTNPKPLKPGKYYNVAWESLPQDYIFRKGHRLALVIAGTDFDPYEIEEIPTGATVTVDLRGSRITIPVTSATDFAKPTRTWRGPAHVNLPTPKKRDFH